MLRSRVEVRVDGVEARAVVTLPAALYCLPLGEARQEIERALVDAQRALESTLTSGDAVGRASVLARTG